MRLQFVGRDEDEKMRSGGLVGLDNTLNDLIVTHC